MTARAVGSLSVLAEYAAPLLTAGGHLVAWKGSPDPEEVADGEHPDAVAIAERILTTQEAEIQQMQQLLGSRA